MKLARPPLNGCDGAKGTTPEAALCRKCARSQPEASAQPFVVQMVRIDASALGARLHCELFLPTKKA